jgi:hypothetical protein
MTNAIQETIEDINPDLKFAGTQRRKVFYLVSLRTRETSICRLPDANGEALDVVVKRHDAGYPIPLKVERPNTAISCSVGAAVGIDGVTTSYQLPKDGDTKRFFNFDGKWFAY